MDHRPRPGGALDKRHQTFPRNVREAPPADAADAAPAFLGRHRDNDLLSGSPAAVACVAPANVGFIDLNLATKMIATGSNHRAAQLVQPGPGRLVAAQTQLPLQVQGAHPVLLAGDKPHRQKPRPQRFSGVLENRARRQRRLPPAGPAPETSSRHHPWIVGHAAFCASEPIWPTHALHIFAARGGVAEPPVHLVEGAGVVRSRLGPARIVHPQIVSDGLRA